MGTYNRHRALNGVAPIDIIAALDSPDLGVRRGAIEELKLLAIAERDLLERNSWVARQPTYNALAYAFNQELRLYKLDNELWEQEAHARGQRGHHFPAAAATVV